MLGWAVALIGVACAGAIADGSTAAAHPHPAAPGAAVPAAATSHVAEASGVAAGLLPAEAFGAGARTMRLPADRLQQVAGMARGLAGGLQIGPAPCAAALGQVLADAASVRDAGGELARAGHTVTAEVLASTSPRIDAVAQLTDAVRGCTSARVDAAGHGSATIGVSAVPGDLGDGAVTVTVTGLRPAAASSAAPQSVAGSGLLGVVRDGDRILLLAQGGAAGTPDRNAFAALLGKAYDTEHAALH